MNHWQNKIFVRLIIPFILGIYLATLKLLFISIILLIVIVILFVTLKKISRFNRDLSFKGSLIIFLSLIYGLAIYHYNDQSFRYGHYTQYHNIKLVEGSINHIKNGTKYQNITINVKRIQQHDLKWSNVHGKMQVMVKNNDAAILPADYISIRGQPKSIAASKNPLEFNYKSYALNHHISHSIFSSPEGIQIIRSDKFNLFRKSYEIQRNLSLRLKNIISLKRESAIASALILGYKDNLDKDIKEIFQNTGAMHILAVSGLHVGIIFMLLSFILSWIPEKKLYQNIIRSILLILGIWSFAFVSGFSMAVIRASIMFSLISFGKSVIRQSNIYNTLSFSAFCILSFDPYLLFDVGFQLSYSALFSIIYFYPKIIILWQPPDSAIFQYLWQMTVVSLAAQIFTLPIIVYYFHQYALGFVLSNLIVLPFSIIALSLGWVTLLTSEFLPEWAIFMGRIIEGCLGLMYEMLEALSNIKSLHLKNIYINTYELVTWFIMLLSIVTSIFYKSKKMILLVLVSFSFLQSSQGIRNYQNGQKTRLISYNYKHPIIELQVGKTMYQYCKKEIKHYHLNRVTIGNHLSNGIEKRIKLQSNVINHIKLDSGEEIKFIISDIQIESELNTSHAIILWNKQLDLNLIHNCLQVDFLFVKANGISTYLKQKYTAIARKEGIKIEWLDKEYWEYTILNNTSFNT